jgi:intersectin
MAMYPYDSAEAGDLNFAQGEMIFVTSKDGEWWTGTVGNTTGLFPGSFATKVETEEVGRALYLSFISCCSKF